MTGIFLATWVVFINVPIPNANASGSELLVKKCEPASWVAPGPQSVRGDFKAWRTETCEIALDHRQGNPESLKSLVLHDIESSARQVVTPTHPTDVVLSNSGRNLSVHGNSVEVVHERDLSGSGILVQESITLAADPTHFKLSSQTHNVLKGSFFATQLKGQDRDVTVERLPSLPGDGESGRYRVTIGMGIELQKTLKNVPPALFESDATSISQKTFDATVKNTLDELGRRL